MSWAAHDLEPYLMRLKMGSIISIPFCLIGSYSPDFFTKWAVYGLDFSGTKPVVDDPIQFHRGWPGVGFTHGLLFPVVIGLLIYLLSKKPAWGISFILGAWAHGLSDTLDSVGVMLFWPFSDMFVHFDVWQYVGDEGRRLDAVAYYTSLGGVWDVFWAVLLLSRWRMLTTVYFETKIFPSDPFWPWAKRKVGMVGCLTIYRTSAFFAFTAIIGWTTWALFVNEFHPSFDWSLGGPQWAPKVGPP